MSRHIELATLATLLAAAPCIAIAAAERPVRFPAGETSTTLRGAIRGDADATFTLRTIEGQTLQTLLSASNRSCYFNVFEPGATEAVHIGSVAGNEFGSNPTKAGEYRFQVYLMRNAARRNETCRYSLSVELTGKPGGASPGVSNRLMQDACRARVSSMYATPTARIRLGVIGRDKDGPIIDGRVNKGAEGVKKFRCRFTPHRQLNDVMAMTPDGE